MLYADIIGTFRRLTRASRKGVFKMKKTLAIILALIMVLSFAACGKKEPAKVDPNAKDEGVMTYAQFIALEDGADAVIEGYITAKLDGTAWGNCSLILQDGDGAYYVYRMPIDAENYAKLEVGQKIKVTGVRTVWSGENEIKEGTATYELVDGTYTFDPVDVTSFYGTDDLIKYQSMKAKVAGAKVKAAALYKWDGSGSQGDDLYLTLEVNGADYQFIVETDLCGGDTEVYKAVEGLAEGQTVDVEGYLYWYNGPQLWMEKVTVK